MAGTAKPARKRAVLKGGSASHAADTSQWLPLQIRIRADKEPDLFELLLGLPHGNASHFCRLALDAAVRSGALTPAGFNNNPSEVAEALQITLDLERERRRSAEVQLHALQARLAITAPTTSNAEAPGATTTTADPRSAHVAPSEAPGAAVAQPPATPATPKAPVKFAQAIAALGAQIDEAESRRAGGPPA